MKYEIPHRVLAAINSRYNVLDHVKFLDFDHDWAVLRDSLARLQHHGFGARDRVLVEHLDTDYYFEQCSVGLNLRNFFLLVQEYQISPGAFVIYTNHFGLDREISLLLADPESTDRPRVIESFLTRLTYNTNMPEWPADLDQIQHHALCAMVLKRTHRNALFNAVRDIDHDRLKLAGTLLQDVHD